MKVWTSFITTLTCFRAICITNKKEKKLWRNMFVIIINNTITSQAYDVLLRTYSTKWEWSTIVPGFVRTSSPNFILVVTEVQGKAGEARSDWTSSMKQMPTRFRKRKTTRRWANFPESGVSRCSDTSERSTELCRRWLHLSGYCRTCKVNVQCPITSEYEGKQGL